MYIRRSNNVLLLCTGLACLFMVDLAESRDLLQLRQGRPRSLSFLSSSFDKRTTFFNETSKKGVVVPSAECRMVNKNKYKDKCAFIHKNCDDEQVGLINYLEFYYCKFGTHAKFVPMGVLALWLCTLFTTIGIAASDFFCVNLSTISNILGMSESMAGVTFLAFGNGSPDVFSTFAAMKVNSGSLAVGELIGAASFITAVVAGAMAIVRPFKVAKKSFVRDVVFFTVSVAFALYFLHDGNIKRWECVVMISFYVSYVIFVVAWHWWQKKVKARRRVEFTARTHYTDLDEHEDEEEDEDGAVSTGTAPQTPQAPPRLVLNTDFDALQNNDNEYRDANSSDEEEDERDQLAGLQSNMRLGRPSMSRMKSPATPIRPSLVGALEFRDVLQTFEKHGNFSGRPIHLRSYSDDPLMASLGGPNSAPGTLIVPVSHQRHGSYSYGGNLHPPQQAGRLSVGGPITPTQSPKIKRGRLRAVSVNDALLNRNPISSRQQFIQYQQQPGIAESPEPPLIDVQRPNGQDQTITMPSLAEEHNPFDDYTLKAPSPNNLLAPPSPAGFSPNASGNVSPNTGSPLILPSVHGSNSSRSSSPHRFLESPRPMSTHSMQMPPAINLPESAYDSSLYADDNNTTSRPLHWWPYTLLPSPENLFCTLFPTLVCFREKSILGKILGLTAAPAVFLLTITLPVVESAEQTEEQNYREEGIRTPNGGESPLLLSHNLNSPVNNNTTPRWQDASVSPIEATRNEQEEDEEEVLEKPREWNRWLACVQCITAPVFMMLTLFAGEIPLLKPTLIALLCGCVGLFVLLLFTSPDRPPKHRYYFCFVGFAVSIGWISTVANEVVGVLKAFGVILGISDAILGLTVFAVGNSLGDLVANITVARLGFPIMALSACFGGPMLNILLGIGISGLYMTTVQPSDRNGYEIQVSSTLMISAVTLLGTLVFLLIAVPWNGWRMSRGIGWALVGIWGVSTVINLVVEVVGQRRSGGEGE